MQHFFVTPDQVEDTRIVVEGSDVNHMKNVLRLRLGEEVMVSDGNNLSYLCKVEAYEEDRVILGIQETKEADTELPSKVYLFQGLPKGDKMELIVQKAVELGVCEVIPKVHEVLSYREALAYSEQLDRVLLPYELAEGMKETKRVITSILPGQSVGIYIGPEGGFEKEEVDQALEQSAEVITLGKRILRTETAGLAALAVLMFHLEG